MVDEALGSWRDGKTKEAILRFVRSVSEEGPNFVPLRSE
jgi:hypothetical protein